MAVPSKNLNIPSRRALLLVNTGSPQAPTPESVRLYLQEFLSDPYIVRLPSWLWQPILKGVVLPRRQFASAQRYRKIWTSDGSPLLSHTKNVAVSLQNVLGCDWQVEYAMRYGGPSVADCLDRLSSRFDDVYVMPLFAQYSEQTVGTIVKIVEENCAGGHVRIVRPWFDAGKYITALSTRITRYVDLETTHLVLSFHGLPVKGSDTYFQQVNATTRLLVKRLGLDGSRFSLTFQSKFGFGDWLEPSTTDTLNKLVARGVRRVAVVCPGFSVDCLETLEEIDIDARDAFMKAGGLSFEYVPCLNADTGIVDFYADWVRASVSPQLENGDK